MFYNWKSPHCTCVCVCVCVCVCFDLNKEERIEKNLGATCPLLTRAEAYNSGMCSIPINVVPSL